jgi:hypothetical protein
MSVYDAAVRRCSGPPFCLLLARVEEGDSKAPNTRLYGNILWGISEDNMRIIHVM